MPNLALNRKYEKKLLLWAMGDLLQPYLDATDQPTKNNTPVTRLKSPVKLPLRVPVRPGSHQLIVRCFYYPVMLKSSMQAPGR